MRVHPAIAALRSDRAPQREAQAAMQQALDAWREEAGMSAALAEFRRFGEGATLEACPTLEAIFTAQHQAEAVTASLVSHFCRAIAANPLGHPPFRNGYDGRAATLLLAKAGRAQLLLQSREPGRFEFTTATYSDALRYDAVLAGKARARIVRIHGPGNPVSFAAEPITLEGGVRLAFDCNTETLQTDAVERRVVTLRLLQAPERPQPSREYCLDSGRLLHMSAGTLAASRREMMAALLGRMERPEAAPVLARMATHEYEESLRWQALRECLALDTAQGFATLSAIARDSADPLSDPASALRARLVEQYPQLREVESA